MAAKILFYGDDEPEKEAVKMKEEKDVTDERKFFVNEESFHSEKDYFGEENGREYRHPTKRELILGILERPDLMSVDSVDGDVYKLDFCKDLRDLSDTLHVQLLFPKEQICYEDHRDGRCREGFVCPNLASVVAAYHKNDDIIKGELAEKTKKMVRRG